MIFRISRLMSTVTFTLLVFIVVGCSPRFDYAILHKGVRPSNSQPSSLSDSELLQLEVLISECTPNLSRSLKKYRFQLVPYQDEEGDKLVLVNAFCSHEGDYWKEDLIMVMDGGDCYYNMTVDLTNNQCLSIIINGEA